MSKHIVITGAASGIGYGIAEFMLKKGHTVTLADMNENAVTDAVNKLGGEQAKAFALQLDVTDMQAVSALPDMLHSPADALVNNAGIQHVSKLETFPAEKWQKLIEVMLVGPAMLTKALLPGMRERGHGRIINVGSIHSVIASPYKSAYIAAKHGLLGFAKTVALETGDVDITINTLCPAYVKTPLVEKQIASQAFENNMSEEDVINKIMLEPMPKKAFIEIEELAESAAFLLSDAAKNITAQTIILDGGWTAR